MTQAQLRTATKLSEEHIKWIAATLRPQRDLLVQTNKARYTIAPNGDVTTILEHIQ